MGNDAELLALRLALIGIIFLFVLVAALTMRSGLRPAGVRRAVPRTGGPNRLVVVSPADTGLAVGTAFQLVGEMTIGRSAHAGIVLGDASVSGEHAVIGPLRGGWLVRDLGSTNGTLVDGRVAGHQGTALLGGEELTLGSVVLRYTGHG